MRLFSWLRLGCGVLAASLAGGVSYAATWFPLGPFGGSARSFAVDPADSRHLFLGTATGWIYDSHDGGEHWSRVAQISKRNDLVIDHIVPDHTNPKRLIVGAYTVDHLGDGGLFISEDYGKTWYAQAEMRGQSVRSLSRSTSDPQMLIAGTLRGVYRSPDNGVHWVQISPEGSSEIKEVQSVAIDPADPNVIYAGTWHLPWKTTDGGKTWANIKDGIIDDSDVFSIIVDPQDPKVVYASACSGIYKSTNAGELFHKVQGIPSAARRTRTLEQDPENLQTVYAGTTEGLYRTQDAGAHWDRLTPDDVIVNDVYVDPKNSNHVVLATDRGGVYRSEDAGTTFQASNDGFSARQVIAYAADPQHAGTVYVGVVNDKTTGGVFQSTDGGVRWQQQSEGLNGADIFSLLSLDDGTLLAGTGHGVFRLQGASWQDSSGLEGKPLPAKGEKPGNVVLPAPTRLTSPGPVKHGPGSGTTPQKKSKPAVHKPAAEPTSMQRSSRRGVFLLTSAQRKRVPPQKAVVQARTSAARSAAHRSVVHGERKAPAHTAHLVNIRAHGHAVAKAQPRTARPTLIAVPSPSRRSSVGQTAAAAKPAAKTTAPVQKATQAERVDAVVYSMARFGDGLFAATSTGLLRSADAGEHWTAVDALAMPEVHYIATLHAASAAGAPSPSMILVGGLQRLALSPDGGASWDTVALPADLTQIGAIAIDGDKNLWVGGREGVWLSTDYGASWKTLRNLFLTEVDSIYFDAVGSRIFVTASNSPVAFSVATADRKVTYVDTGWKLRFVRPVGDHLIGATLFDGIVVEPKMVESPLAATPAGN